MNVTNLTTHNINMMDASHAIRTKIPPSGKILDIAVNRKHWATPEQLQIEDIEYSIENLPEEIPDHFYIIDYTKLLILKSKTDRTDFIAPDYTNHGVRNFGKIVGILKLTRITNV